MDKKILQPSNKNFGLVFFFVFLLISMYPLMYGDNLDIWFLITAFVFLILGLLNSIILTPLNKIWFRFGIILGKIISPIIMGIIFFFIVTPTALLMRLFKKDLLNLKFDKRLSYWIRKEDKNNKMKNQF
tara:strand:+ start:138 stop:524 length:387 start_codon:yes stop_codon:yes gene_type:complete